MSIYSKAGLSRKFGKPFSNTLHTSKTSGTVCLFNVKGKAHLPARQYSWSLTKMHLESAIPQQLQTRNTGRAEPHGTLSPFTNNIIRSREVFSIQQFSLYVLFHLDS